MANYHVNKTFVEVRDDAPGRIRSASDIAAPREERVSTEAGAAPAQVEAKTNEFKTFDPFHGEAAASASKPDDDLEDELAELERQMRGGDLTQEEQNQQVAFATFDPMATFDPDPQVQEFTKSLRVNAPGLDAQVQQEAYKTFDAFELGGQSMPSMPQVGMPQMVPVQSVPVMHVVHHVPVPVGIPEASKSEEPPADAPTEAASSTAKNKLADQDGRTTVMMRNLPPNLTRANLLELIDSHGFSGDYDFLYEPIDFVKQVALGYAFVNLTSCENAVKFWKVFDRFRAWPFPSKKMCRLSWSVPCQGLESHIERYRNSPLMHPDVPDEVRPVLFQGGVRAAFPPATVELKAPRLRASHRLQAFWSKEKEDGAESQAAKPDAAQDGENKGPWADVVDGSAS